MGIFQKIPNQKSEEKDSKNLNKNLENKDERNKISSKVEIFEDLDTFILIKI